LAAIFEQITAAKETTPEVTPSVNQEGLLVDKKREVNQQRPLGDKKHEGSKIP